MKKTLALVLALVMALGMFSMTGVLAEGEKKLIYPLPQDPQTLDPTMNSYSYASYAIKQMFSGLYRVAADGVTMEPCLAEGVQVSEDGLTYTFTLRKDLKWSDGSPLTAKDFDYTYKHTLNKDLASKAAKDLFNIKNAKAYNAGEVAVEEVGISAPDDTTLILTLEAPTPWFMTLLAGTGFMPVKQSVVDASTADKPWTMDPATYVSCGPFRMKEYKLKERLSIVKNPNYVFADQVKLDAIDIVIIEAMETELVAYENGEIDVADTLNPEAIAKYKDTPEYNVMQRVGLTYCDFNCEKAPFTDKRVRQALSMVIDRQLVVDRILKSMDQPAMGFVPWAQRSVTDPSKAYREVAGDMFAMDVEKAKALLAEAGFTDLSKFPPVELVISASQVNKDWAQAMQAMWKQTLGIESTITTLESGVFWDELDAGKFDVDKNGFTANYADPLANLFIFRTGSNAYENRWDDPVYDEMIDKCAVELDPAKREAMMIEAEKYLADQMPAIPMYGIADDFLAKPYVSGMIKNVQGHVLFEYVDINK